MLHGLASHDTDNGIVLGRAHRPGPLFLGKNGKFPKDFIRPMVAITFCRPSITRSTSTLPDMTEKAKSPLSPSLKITSPALYRTI